jgi:hypothetical protein
MTFRIILTALFAALLAGIFDFRDAVAEPAANNVDANVVVEVHVHGDVCGHNPLHVLRSERIALQAIVDDDNGTPSAFVNRWIHGGVEWALTAYWQMLIDDEIDIEGRERFELDQSLSYASTLLGQLLLVRTTLTRWMAQGYLDDIDYLITMNERLGMQRKLQDASR